MARRAFVPITMGASGSKSLALDGFLVTDARFPPLARLAPHVHERATLAVMLEGSFDLGITNRVYPCEPGCVVTEPAEERHGNVLGTAGAHVLVVQPEPTALDRLGHCGRMFEDVRYAARGPGSGVAWRIVQALASPDSATPLEVEGLVLEMFALASRQGQLERRSRHAPQWLVRTRELLHASFRQPPPIDELAREAGVHPDYLARAFRLRFGVPVGTYVRRLRLEWAAARLAATEEPIARIALDAGFADQSHFTRAFKRYAGLTPGEYRQTPPSPGPSP
jgi:AraC-like DNA-binding protein